MTYKSLILVNKVTPHIQSPDWPAITVLRHPRLVTSTWDQLFFVFVGILHLCCIIYHVRNFSILHKAVFSVKKYSAII